MNVPGFEEALASSIPLMIEEGLVVQVASVPGLALLKLVAWADRGSRMNKDVADLCRLVASYAEAGNTDRIYDREMNWLETAGFDIESGRGRTARPGCGFDVLVLRTGHHRASSRNTIDL